MKHLNNLRKLAANKSCATCTHEDKMGFKDVCMKFKIFICSDCKSAHQAFSHRCKSITMSNWTHAEVMELDASTNGGNEIHNATHGRAHPAHPAHPAHAHPAHGGGRRARAHRRREGRRYRRHGHPNIFHIPR